MCKNFKPYVSMLFWFALGLIVSILFCKSLILNWDTNDHATDRPSVNTPNLTISLHIRKRSLPES